ncbi:MAG: response regulator [Chloroflexales bacterium]|nr:response regulator [Chloroflexales bacterium]
MMQSTQARPIEILLVEDSPADVVITQDALAEARVLNTIHVVEDGAEALAFLRQQGPYGDAPRPDLILLDLNLPRKSGREVLAEIKVDPALRRIPVVVLTTSRAEEDVWKAYDLHANCYVVKPLDFAAFVQAVQSIHQFWLSVVTLPAEGEGHHG